MWYIECNLYVQLSRIITKPLIYILHDWYEENKYLQNGRVEYLSLTDENVIFHCQFLP